MLQEHRVFPPPAEFSAKAHIKSLEEYERIYAEAAQDPEAFWGKIAQELHWFEPWTKVLEWNAPWAKWFVGGKFNLSYNCLDRHVASDAARQDRDPLGGRTRRYPHADLRRSCSPKSNCFANALKDLGVVKGDRVVLLHGHGARACHRHAGLCPNWRRALGHLRRLFRQRHRRPRQRSAIHRPRHPGLRAAARHPISPQRHG